jgi:Uncharacterised protein family (UPF0158)
VTRGWSDDHGFRDGELDEGLVAGRLVTIEPLPADTTRGWMEAFVSGLEDGWARDALRAVLAAPLALARFEPALGRFPAERQLWLACRDARLRSVLRDWLEAHDVAAASEPPARLRGV